MGKHLKVHGKISGSLRITCLIRGNRCPKESIDDNYNGGTPLMIEDFARCIIEDRRPPIDIVDALNMTAPGLVSEISRDRGGVPVDVPDFSKST